MLLLLLTWIIGLAILGFAVWLVITYVPMPEAMKTTLVVVVILALLLWIVRVALTGGGFPRLVP